MKVKPESEIFAFVEKYASPLSIRVVEVSFKQGKNPSLTIFVDKEGGIDLDACELFHNTISEPLDEFDPTYGEPYTLNVSSPGLDRAYKTKEDFLAHIGQRVEVKLYSAIKGKKFYDGILLSYDGVNAVIKVDDKNTLSIDMKNIVKMNNYIDFDWNKAR